MRILVTNDDGIDSVGLHVLARRLGRIADVVVVAPDKEYSGFGAALGTLHLLRPEVHRVRLDGIDETWAVTGPPALCVYFARMGAFGEFDIVVSGINPGVNTGRAIYHSGTVGAVLTARNGGYSGIAVSQNVDGFGIEGQAWDAMLENMRWDSAAEVAAVAAEGLLADRPDVPAVINLNVPNLPVGEIAGWRHAEVGTVPPRSVADVRLVPTTGHEDAFHVEMDWGDPVELPAETDGGTVERNHVAVTYVSPFVHDGRDDLGGVVSGLEGLLG